jgi:ribosomal protein L24
MKNPAAERTGYRNRIAREASLHIAKVKILPQRDGEFTRTRLRYQAHSKNVKMYLNSFAIVPPISINSFTDKPFA